MCYRPVRSARDSANRMFCDLLPTRPAIDTPRSLQRMLAALADATRSAGFGWSPPSLSTVMVTS